MPLSADGCQRCGWRPRRGELWPTLGELGCDWIEAYCVLGEGDSYGKPFRLYGDQQRFVYSWYEFCPKCGQWRYSETIWSAATGSGKTQFMAALAALEFVGPREIRPRSANVVIAAAGYDQAGLLFGQTALIFGGRDEILKEAPLLGVCEVYENHITRHDGEPGQVTRVAAVAGTNEGGQPTLYICDEVHEWGDVGDRKARLHMVIGKSTTKRQLRCVVDGEEVNRGRGRIVNLSTAGFDVRHSLLGAMYTRGKKAQENPATSPRLLFYWREARDGLDYELPEHREIACRDASGAAGIIWDVADRVAEYDKREVQRHEWIRYYANKWVDVSDSSWLRDHPNAWDERQGSWELTGDEPTVLAYDAAVSGDCAAVCEAVELHDGRIAVSGKIWWPERGLVDTLDAVEYIKDRAAELGPRFRGVAYDPAYADSDMRKLESRYGLTVIDFSQQPQSMGPACQLAYRLIVGTGRDEDQALAEEDEDEDRFAGRLLVHDGDADRGRHVKNAVKHETERYFTLKKQKSQGKIDWAVAMCIALWTLRELPEPVPWEDTVW